MNTEIERKFLVQSGEWRNETTEVLLIRQGYLSTDRDRAVRVRRSGERAWLTIKGRPVDGAAPEFEYEIPVAEADAILTALAKKPLIEKKRHLVPHGGLIWEVDEFLGENAGLVLAEVELSSPGQPVSPPGWIGREVTGDSRYSNASLVANPFSAWG